jgi:hypothetical protein
VTWHWEFEWLLNLATVAALGISSAYVAHCIWRRNKAGERDRLVWGLVAFFSALFSLSAYTAIAILEAAPDSDFVRIPLRVGAVGAALIFARAVKMAGPLVYLSDISLLNERILNKRRLIDAQESQIAAQGKLVAAQERELDALRREVARIHALHPEGENSPSA